jgi:hypothetical protein
MFSTVMMSSFRAAEFAPISGFALGLWRAYRQALSTPA